MRKTKRFNWPLKVEDSKEVEVPEFYEGAFINMLLNKVIIDLAGRFLNRYIQISRILDQPYDINLQVTSVVSRFCLIPHVYLTEYALDPLLETRAGARTLYNTLLVSSNHYHSIITRDFQGLVGTLETRAARIPNFRDKLVSTRKRLIGMDQVRTEDLP